MFRCQSCGHTTSMNTDTCPYCGESAQTAGNDPYQASEAVIAASRPISAQADEDGEPGYDVTFTVSGIIGETFNIWSNSLGKTLPISLIPFIPIVGMLVAVVLIVISALGGLFSSGFEGLDSSAFSSAFDSLGTGSAVVIIVINIGVLVCIIPSFCGHFRFMDERERHGKHKHKVVATYIWAFRFVLPILGLIVLFYVGWIASLMPIALFPDSEALVLVYMLVDFALMMFLFVKFILVFPIMTIEGKGLFAALAESSRLVSGNFWRVLGILFVHYLVMTGVMMAFILIALVPILGVIVLMMASFMVTTLYTALFFAIYAGIKTKAQLA